MCVFREFLSLLRGVGGVGCVGGEPFLLCTNLLCTHISHRSHDFSGLLCFYDKRLDLEVETMMADIWNPTVRKSVGIVVPNVFHFPKGLTFIGFRVCPNTSDPKLVKINTFGFRTVDLEVDVFNLSTRVWKAVSDIPIAFRSCDLT